MKEHLLALDSFLKQSLDGFRYLDWVEKGNITALLANPEAFRLNHISSYPDAWADDETIVIEFNDGVHFCFIPLDRSTNTKGLHYINGKWQQRDKWKFRC
ncbi:hypothetical protein [Paenibacillus xylaniclasticus]|uniref:hypothetical protein n=1 Tax=Paenibacillus xylaniclasticus TaxID=588083 RepID=UPI000FD70A91|nr:MULTISPECIES: hypothetical protein [Paenibacillus]GFN32534.1 hypothetical protein PCURB6_27940 [Paenibacillus curdlanolyticus]